MIDKDWILNVEGMFFYICLFIIVIEFFFGVVVFYMYKFFIIFFLVGFYYKEGIKLVKIVVESEFVCVVKGGMGNVKIVGNYVLSLKV